MNKELKIRIGDPKPMADRLVSLGAVYTKTEMYEYTYFNQPRGKVLKLTRRGGRTYQTIIEAENGRFVIKLSREVHRPKELAKQLESQYGIKRPLTNQRIFYRLGEYELTLNDIPGVGNFLIVEGENPSLDFITCKLGIKDPEVITDSFDNL